MQENLDLSSLSDKDLLELYDMVLEHLEYLKNNIITEEGDSFE